MRPSDRIEESIRNARLTTREATDERIISAAEAEMAKTQQQRPAHTKIGGSIRSTIMNGKWTKLATAAAILVAAMMGIYAITGSIKGTSITIGQIKTAMQEIDWMQIINKGGTENENHGEPEIDWFSFASKIHIALTKGTIEYEDFRTGKRLWWNPEQEHITEDTIDQAKEFAYGATGPFEMMNNSVLHAAGGSNVDKKLGTYQGHKVEVWKTSNSLKGNPGYTRTLNVYIDIDKKLPIAATYDHNKPDGTVLRESEIQFSFPATGPADIYEAGAPVSALVKSATKQ